MREERGYPYFSFLSRGSSLLCFLLYVFHGYKDTQNNNPMSLQKESEWEKEFDKRFPSAIPRKGYIETLNKLFGIVVNIAPETATEIVIAQNAENKRLRIKLFIKELLSSREKEIAEEVKNMPSNRSKEKFCPFDCTETRPHGHVSDGKIYPEPAHNVPAEKWEEEFHHLFEILTDSGKNLVNGRDDFEYWSFHDSLKSFIRQAISEAVEEERRYISSKVVDTLTTVWAPKTEEEKTIVQDV